MPTTTERLRSIAELLQSQNVTPVLAQSINAYLAGLRPLDNVRAARSSNGPPKTRWLLPRSPEYTGE